HREGGGRVVFSGPSITPRVFWGSDTQAQPNWGSIPPSLWYHTPMTLNIKNPEAHRLAQELATLTGESMATAVTESVRERLARVRQQREPLAGRLLAIGK